MLAEPSPSVPHPSPEQFASILELRLPREDLAREALLGRCRDALRLRLRAVTVAPADLDDVALLLRDTPVNIATTIDPAGGATTAVKQYAARDALRRGARIVEAAIHRGKMLSRESSAIWKESCSSSPRRVMKRRPYSGSRFAHGVRMPKSSIF